MAHGTERGGQSPGALGAGGNLQPSAQQDYRPQLRCADRTRPSDALRKIESSVARGLASSCMTLGMPSHRVFLQCLNSSQSQVKPECSGPSELKFLKIRMTGIQQKITLGWNDRTRYLQNGEAPLSNPTIPDRPNPCRRRISPPVSG